MLTDMEPTIGGRKHRGRPHTWLQKPEDVVVERTSSGPKRQGGAVGAITLGPEAWPNPPNLIFGLIFTLYDIIYVGDNRIFDFK